MASDQQIADYLAGQLDPELLGQLEEELLDDPNSRAELIGQRRISAGLHALLGDSAVLERAIVSTLRSTPEETVVARIFDATVERQISSETRKAVWLRRWHRGLIVFGKAAAVIALAAVSAAALHLRRDSVPVAVVRDLSEAQWSLPAPPRVGAELRRGWISLTTGVAELEMRSGARVVIQSPARFRLSSANELELTVGKLSAYVPSQASGFTVQTEAGAIVDLGTRFGVDVQPVRGAEVHVMEGRVEVQAGKGTERALGVGQAVSMRPSTFEGITSIDYHPEQFPSGSIDLPNILVGGGFESDSLVAIDSAPRQFGLWSGDPALVVPESDGVLPRNGQQMLRFELPETGKPRPCEQWQIVDIKELRKNLNGVSAEAIFSVWFNRAARATGQANMAVTLAAFKGDPSQAPHFWAARQDKALGIAEAYIRTDNDPLTWERAEARLVIPKDADFLLVQIAANYPLTPDSRTGPNGHYADDAALEIHLAPQSSQVASMAPR